MARFGEGDPRWIVEDRKDGANVNNWHWTERDVTTWSIRKIKSLFLGSRFEDEGNFFEITNVSTSGLTTINVRKAQLKFIYDLEIDLDFKYNDDATGRIQILEFSFETGSDKISFSVSIDVKTPTSDSVYTFVKNSVKAFTKPILEQYMELFLDYRTHGLSPPQREILEDKPSPKIDLLDKTKPNIAVNGEPKAAEKLAKGRLAELESNFLCSPSFLFDIFTQQEKINAFTRSSATFALKKDADFCFFNGNINGKVLEYDIGKSLILSWRFKDWPMGFISKASFKFEPIENGTRLRLLHEDILEEAYERVVTGWDRNFFQPIQHVFGVGCSTIKNVLF